MKLLPTCFLLTLWHCAVAETAPDFSTAFHRCKEQAKSQQIEGNQQTTYVRNCMAVWRDSLPSRSTLPDATQRANPSHPIESLIFAGDQGALAILSGSLQSDVEGYQKADGDLKAAIAQLDSTVTAAVKAAKGNTGLVKAIKEYYASASAYLASGVPTNAIEKTTGERLKIDMDVREKALRLEQKLSIPK